MIIIKIMFIQQIINKKKKKMQNALFFKLY